MLRQTSWPQAEVLAKFTDATDADVDAATKVGVQRYKGLGEMNPSQLWETTMDPTNRVLRQIELNDDLLADEYFDILMGDKVEPRRDFITSYAHEVKNLDI